MEKVEEEQREKVSGNDNKLFTARELASKQALTLGADSAVDRGAAEQQRGRGAEGQTGMQQDTLQWRFLCLFLCCLLHLFLLRFPFCHWRVNRAATLWRQLASLLCNSRRGSKTLVSHFYE